MMKELKEHAKEQIETIAKKSDDTITRLRQQLDTKSDALKEK